ncbi:unnamed protein product [Camellia sinensis]
MSNVPPPSNYSSSYPPLFRPNSTPTRVVDQDDPTTHNPGSDPLPVIDLHGLNHDAKHTLAEACKVWGIFRLVNHGIPITLLNQLHDHAKELLSLSFESKQALRSGSMSYFWGTPALTPSGLAIASERSPSSLSINWVEGFNIPLSQLSVLQADGDPILDTFRHLLDEYGRHQSRVATTIFKAMAENLNLLGQEKCKSYISPSTGFIRVYRYPRCSESNHNNRASAWGMDAHADSSVISILNHHDQVGGLEVYKDHKWLDIKPIPNTLVVNLGDMTQAMSDDEYKSVKHRVKANKYDDRISIGYFVFPAQNGVIQSSKYKPFTYSDFQAQVQKDLMTMGFKVGLDRFKLNKAS